LIGRRIFLIDEYLRIDALEITFLFRPLEAALDEIGLALFQFLLAGSLSFGPVMGIQLVSEIRQDEKGYHEYTGYPDDEFDEGEHSFQNTKTKQSTDYKLRRRK
jgi:hypothetical protein